MEGWRDKYTGILREFGYDEEADTRAARMLDHILGKRVPLQRLSCVIRGRTVFVVGAGPSLPRSLDILREFPAVPRIVADGALAALAGGGLAADIVVTDLDGDWSSLEDAGRGDTVFVVHAHGDNIERLHLVRRLANCIGTTQGEELGGICNFGGFTDGDRAVFLAEHFGASRIVLIGMDLGSRIGRYSFTRRRDRGTKLRKLRTAEGLLEWLAAGSRSEIRTMSRPLPGIGRISRRDLRGLADLSADSNEN